MANFPLQILSSSKVTALLSWALQNFCMPNLCIKSTAAKKSEIVFSLAGLLKIARLDYIDQQAHTFQLYKIILSQPIYFMRSEACFFLSIYKSQENLYTIIVRRIHVGNNSHALGRSHGSIENYHLAEWHKQYISDYFYRIVIFLNSCAVPNNHTYTFIH